MSVDDFRGPSRTAIPNEGRFRMKSSLLGACATIALLAAAVLTICFDKSKHSRKAMCRQP